MHYVIINTPVTQLKKFYRGLLFYAVLWTWRSIAAAVATRPRADCSSMEGHIPASTLVIVQVQRYECVSVCLMSTLLV